jgi:microcystin-dependent protein
MSLTNPKTVVTEERLSAFYQKLLPYLGGSADAGFTPVGTIIAMMSNSAPANYLVCDGTVYNISDYQELADHFFNEFGSRNYFGGNGTTTFAVPDLRGEFIRGTGTNSHTNQGNGADVGVHQDATENPYITRYRDSINHDNNLLINSDVAKNDPSSNLQPRNPDAHIPGRLAYHNIKITSSTVDSSQSISKYTVRPTNTSVLYCIATKNIYLNPSLDYSTSEKVVGTWIDGKPLYQKSIPFTISSSNHKATIDISSLSIETLISGEAYTSWKSSGSIQGQFIITGTSMNSSGGGYSSAMFTASGNTALTIQYSGTENLGLFDTMDGYATIRYTKTS